MPLKRRVPGRFNTGRIKKIIQLDNEVGRVTAAVPVVISKALESFIEVLLKNIDQQATQSGLRLLTSGLVKKCILSDERFDFLRGLVANIPDLYERSDGATSSSSGSQTPTSLSPQIVSRSSNFTFNRSRSYNSRIKKPKLKKQLSFMDDEIDLGNDSFCVGIDRKALKQSCNTVQNGDSKGSSGLKMSSPDNGEFSNVPGKFRNVTPVFKRSKTMFTHSSKSLVQNTQEIQAGAFTVSLTYPMEFSPDFPGKTLTTVPSFFTTASLPTCSVWSNDGIDEDYDS